LQGCRGCEAQRQRYRHRQIALAHWRAVDEQRDRRRHTLALGDIGLARRLELETEDVVALRNRLTEADLRGKKGTIDLKGRKGGEDL
jgi:hypothetical protein